MRTRCTAALSVEGLEPFLWRAPGARRRDLRDRAGDASRSLLGLNGAGKSTLFSLVTRLYGTQRGAIRIFGHDVDARSPARRCACSASCSSRARSISISRSCRTSPITRRCTASARARRARAPTRCWRGSALPTARSDKVRDLSGGQMRRVEIARALLHRAAAAAARRADRRPRHQVARRHPRPCAPAGAPRSASRVLWATHLIDEVDRRRRRDRAASGRRARARRRCRAYRRAGAQRHRRRLHAPDPDGRGRAGEAA